MPGQFNETTSRVLHYDTHLYYDTLTTQIYFAKGDRVCGAGRCARRHMGHTPTHRLPLLHKMLHFTNIVLEDSLFKSFTMARMFYYDTHALRMFYYDTHALL